jgi:hypothetical protein
MMRPDAHVAVFVCMTPVDMRKQAATLALIVEQTLKRSIFEHALYFVSGGGSVLIFRPQIRPGLCGSTSGQY